MYYILMSEKKEEQSIEEYWNLFRDSLPGAESSVEATYRMLEVLSRQVDEFSDPQEREGRYPQLVVARNRKPSYWKITLSFWSPTSEEVVKAAAVGEIYSTVIAEIFEQVRQKLRKEVNLRSEWVKQSEDELVGYKDNHRKSERFLSSLGTYSPEQQNLPLGRETKEAT